MADVKISKYGIRIWYVGGDTRPTAQITGGNLELRTLEGLDDKTISLAAKTMDSMITNIRSGSFGVKFAWEHNTTGASNKFEGYMAYPSVVIEDEKIKVMSNQNSLIGPDPYELFLDGGEFRPQATGTGALSAGDWVITDREIPIFNDMFSGCKLQTTNGLSDIDSNAGRILTISGTTGSHAADTDYVIYFAGTLQDLIDNFNGSVMGDMWTASLFGGAVGGRFATILQRRRFPVQIVPDGDTEQHFVCMCDDCDWMAEPIGYDYDGTQLATAEMVDDANPVSVLLPRCWGGAFLDMGPYSDIRTVQVSLGNGTVSKFSVIVQDSFGGGAGSQGTTEEEMEDRVRQIAALVGTDHIKREFQNYHQQNYTIYWGHNNHQVVSGSGDGFSYHGAAFTDITLGREVEQWRTQDYSLNFETSYFPGDYDGG